MKILSYTKDKASWVIVRLRRYCDEMQRPLKIISSHRTAPSEFNYPSDLIIFHGIKSLVSHNTFG